MYTQFYRQPAATLSLQYPAGYGSIERRLIVSTVNIAAYKRHAGRRFLLILDVSFQKEVDQRHLFDENALVEKLPADDRVQHQAHRIGQNGLGADGPPEPARVRRMPHQAVHAVRDQRVAFVLVILDDVIEIGVGRDDGQFPQHFAGYANGYADQQNGEALFHRRQQPYLEHKFQPTRGGRYHVRRRMVQHKRVRAERAWVCVGNGQVFAKVKGGHEEKVHAEPLPFGRREDYGKQREAEANAERCGSLYNLESNRWDEQKR